MKALLLIWVGIFDNQVMSITQFDTIGECEAAKAAIIAHEDAPNSGVHCIPYAER